MSVRVKSKSQSEVLTSENQAWCLIPDSDRRECASPNRVWVELGLGQTTYWLLATGYVEFLSFNLGCQLKL